MKPKKAYKREKSGLTVTVIDDNVQRAIKKLRRIMKQQNIMTEYYQHRYFVKPSVKNVKKRNSAKFKAKIWQKQQEEKKTEKY